MRIVVISFEKESHSPFDDIIRDYKGRIASRLIIEEKFLRIKIKDIPSQIELIVSQYKNPKVCVLDESGRTLNTMDFIKMLIRFEQEGRTIIFIIGPPNGFEKPFRFKYDLLISLSSLTFSHQIARLLLFEQIYRTYCFLSNHPYNK